MDKLYHLQDVIRQVYAGLAADKSRPGILYNFRSLLQRPLIRFDEAYSAFISSVAMKSDTYDMWLNVQLRVITMLGEEQVAIKQLATAFKEVVSTTEGGDALDAKDPKDFERFSFLIALAFRIYLDDFPLATEDLPPDPQAGQGGNQ